MWIDELKENVIDLSLKRMHLFISQYGEPSYRIIHVGGTNGKGSVCQFIYSILKRKHKVGLYTSPHLEKVNERIIVNDEMIGDDEIEKYAHLKKFGFTYFEALTAIALLYFGEKNVDYAVMEVGLGGRLDATNVVKADITIITNVAMEHEQFLGGSIEKIAAEKTGIIGKAPVITAAKGRALEIIEREAMKRGVDLYVVGREIKWERKGGNKFLIESNERYEVESPLYGSFQGENIAIAIKACELLGIEKEDIVKGIEEARWPGRMEVVSNFLIDGAHNPHAIEAFSSSVNEMGDVGIIIFGAMKDKNIEEMIKRLPEAKAYFAVEIDNERAIESEEIAAIGRKCGRKFIVKKNLEEAVELAERMVSKDELICIVGSLYLAGEARKILKKKGYSCQ